MEFLNPEVAASLEAGNPLRLNLGSGQRRRPGFVNVDHLALPGVDILADLNEPLALLPSNCVAEVYSRHVLEHVQRFMELMAELHRVCRPDARLEIIVPHFSNPYGYSDPTHVRFFGLYTFYYFSPAACQLRRRVPTFYTPYQFRVERVECRLLRGSLIEKAARRIVQPLLNRSPEWIDWYERRLSHWLPANDMRYVLRPIKDQSLVDLKQDMAA